jgi:hypothetical protein
MMREGSPLSVGGTGDLWNTERQQMSLCKAAFLGSETLLRSCISLGYPCYIASAVPRKGWVRSAQGKDGMRHTALQARGNGLDLPYRHWLAGYLTAVTKLTKDTVDMRGTTDIDGMLVLLEHYCIKNLQHSFSRALESLGADRYPKRMTAHATITLFGGLSKDAVLTGDTEVGESWSWRGNTVSTETVPRAH